jgi:hypothetical protein
MGAEDLLRWTGKVLVLSVSGAGEGQRTLEAGLDHVQRMDS